MTVVQGFGATSGDKRVPFGGVKKKPGWKPSAAPRRNTSDPLGWNPLADWKYGTERPPSAGGIRPGNRKSYTRTPRTVSGN